MTERSLPEDVIRSIEELYPRLESFLQKAVETPRGPEALAFRDFSDLGRAEYDLRRARILGKDDNPTEIHAKSRLRIADIVYAHKVTLISDNRRDPAYDSAYGFVESLLPVIEEHQETANKMREKFPGLFNRDKGFEFNEDY